MYDRILVPTDGSEGTAETLEHAVHAARQDDATVHVLYVVDQRRYLAADADTQDDVVATLEAEGEEAVETAAERVREAGLDAVTDLRQGVPHREIVDYAGEVSADLVVMGAHGRTGRDRLAALGSVTERVLEGVDVPVLVVDIAN
ncbi:MAG: universal stress protein [Halorientalis sp.]